MSQKLKTLLKNDNFVNNQNYIFDHSKKKSILWYAYSTKQNRGLLQKKLYYMRNTSNNWYKSWRLYKGNFWYVEKPSLRLKAQSFFTENNFYIWGYLWLILFIVALLYWWNLTETIVYNWVETVRNINLSELNLFQRFNELRLFLLFPVGFLVFAITKDLVVDYHENEYYLFLEKVNSDNIIIYRNTKWWYRVKIDNRIHCTIASFITLIIVWIILSPLFEKMKMSSRNRCIETYFSVSDLNFKENKTQQEKQKVQTINNKALWYCNDYLISSWTRDAEILRYIGHIYNMWLWEEERAIKSYLKAVELNPQDYKSYNNLWAIYEKLYQDNWDSNNLDQAFEFAKNAFAINKDDFYREGLLIKYHNKINKEKKSWDNKELIQLLEEAVKLDTINYWMNYIVGSAYADLFASEKNTEYFNKADLLFTRSFRNKKLSSYLETFDWSKRWIYYQIGLVNYNAWIYEYQWKYTNKNVDFLNRSIDYIKQWMKINKFLHSDDKEFKINSLSVLQLNYQMLFALEGNNEDWKKSIDYWEEILKLLSVDNVKEREQITKNIEMIRTTLK